MAVADTEPLIEKGPVHLVVLRILCGADVLVAFRRKKDVSGDLVLTYVAHDERSEGSPFAEIVQSREFANRVAAEMDRSRTASYHLEYPKTDRLSELFKRKIDVVFAVKSKKSAFVFFGAILNPGLRISDKPSTPKVMAKSHVGDRGIQPGKLLGPMKFVHFGVATRLGSRFRLASPRKWIFASCRLYLDGLSPTMCGKGDDPSAALDALADSVSEALAGNDQASFRPLIADLIDPECLTPEEALRLWVSEECLHDVVDKAATAFEVSTTEIGVNPTSTPFESDDRFYEIRIPTRFSPSETLKREHAWFVEVEKLIKSYPDAGPYLTSSLFRLDIQFPKARFPDDEVLDFGKFDFRISDLKNHDLEKPDFWIPDLGMPDVHNP